MKKTILNSVVCAALAMTALSEMVHAAEVGSMLKADELKAEPFRDAKTISSLAAGDKVDILNKNSGWLQIKQGKSEGWVRMLSVRRGSAATATVAGGGISSGRAGTGKVVSTTGIRGLNEEELKAASFNETELKALESYTVSRQDAQKFAKAGKLTARSVSYLPAEGK